MTDLSGTWSVAAFYRAIADAHRDLDDLNNRCCVKGSNFCCVSALTACGALPSGWPETRAHRLAKAMIWVMDWRDTPHYRDTFFTDASGRLVYHDGFDDLRLWMEELGVDEADDDLPGSLVPLLYELQPVVRPVSRCADHPDPVTMDTLVDRVGPDRMAAFITRLRQEGYVDNAAELGRYAGLKYENLALLEQASRDAGEAEG